MKKIILLLVGLAALTQSFAWGVTGHRAIGLIAEQHLKAKTRKKISKLLNGQSLAMASTWMDEVRSDPKYDYLTDWHWVTIPTGQTYDQTEKNPNGDIIEAILRITKELKQGGLSEIEEAERIKILIHLVGDIHQPLHIGAGEDRGGNDVKVQWFGKNSNLHRVWDSEMIDDTRLSYTELALSLNWRSKSEMVKTQRASVLDWAKESMELRNKVYETGDKGLSYEYSFRNLAIVNNRLLDAGLRLAALFNEIYG